MIDTRELKNLRLTPSEHTFFDSLVVVLSTAAALRQAFVAQLEGKAVPYDDQDSASIRGIPHVTGVQLLFRPAHVLNPLAQDSWPEELVLYEQPLDEAPTRPPDDAQRYRSAKGFRGVTDILMRSAFITYYEAADPKEHFGGSGADWAPVWRFGRIVRNALAHDGCIDIRNKDANPETWRGITYGPEQNGEAILFRDFAIPELLYLMIDMEEAT